MITSNVREINTKKSQSLGGIAEQILNSWVPIDIMLQGKYLCEYYGVQASW